MIDRATLALVALHGIPVNAGSVAMLDQLGQQLGDRAGGHRVWLRINPGFGHGHSRKTNTGGEHSKHGIWPTDIPAALEAIARHGLRLVGLHMHIGSGVDYEPPGARVRRDGAARAARSSRWATTSRAISAGGGLSIPYRDGDADGRHRRTTSACGTPRAAASRRSWATRCAWRSSRAASWSPSPACWSPRCARSRTMGSNHFVLCDAGFNDLVRPAMYGGHHAISVDRVHERAGARRPRPGRGAPPTVVAGPLCESGDVFTQDAGGVVEPREPPPAKSATCSSSTTPARTARP